MLPGRDKSGIRQFRPPGLDTPSFGARTAITLKGFDQFARCEVNPFSVVAKRDFFPVFHDLQHPAGPSRPGRAVEEFFQVDFDRDPFVRDDYLGDDAGQFLCRVSLAPFLHFPFPPKGGKASFYPFDRQFGHLDDL